MAICIIFDLRVIFLWFLNFVIVYPSLSGVCVWAQILKRVLVRLSWNFNMVIWHLYVFDFAHHKIFPATGGFLRAENRKNQAVFREFFEMVNLYEIFYVMKVVGKILRGIFLIGGIVNFHFHQFLEFSDSRFGSYRRFSGNYIFQRGVPRQIWKIIFLVQFIPSKRFIKKNLEINYFASFFPTFCEKPLSEKPRFSDFFEIIMKI